MPFYLITGVPGAGKSTVNAELKARGYESYDGDEDKFAEWFDMQGRVVKVKDRKNINNKFLSSHMKGIAREVAEDLASKAKDKVVFLCNDPENEEKLIDLFDEVFALLIDEETMKHRLTTRTNNRWGKRPIEIEYSLAFKEKWLPLIKKYDYITIDATQPTKEIVDQILEEVN